MAKTIPTRNLKAIAVKATAKNHDRRNGRGHANIAAATAPTVSAFDDPELYVNREISLLEFQKRVLEEAQDDTVPLLERVKFLSIVGSNLDEFFMIRVAGLMRQVDSGTTEVAADGMTPAEQLDATRAEVANIVAASHKCLRRQLLPALERAGI